VEINGYEDGPLNRAQIPEHLWATASAAQSGYATSCWRVVVANGSSNRAARIDRLVRSALHASEEMLSSRVTSRLPDAADSESACRSNGSRTHAEPRPPSVYRTRAPTARPRAPTVPTGFPRAGPGPVLAGHASTSAGGNVANPSVPMGWDGARSDDVAGNALFPAASANGSDRISVRSCSVCYCETAYRQAGRAADALAIFEALVTDSERILGTEHPDTLTTRSNLAGAYQAAGRGADALAIFEALLADSERILGTERPDTITTRSNLPAVYDSAGRTDDARRLRGAD
jgi:tetratricopeptide repeat protein